MRLPVLRRAFAALRGGKPLTAPQARELLAWGRSRTKGKEATPRRRSDYKNWAARERNARKTRETTRKRVKKQTRETAPARARKLQRKLIRAGEDPDLIRVFFVPDAGLSHFQRRYTVNSWGRFMEKDEYREARTRALTRGTFVLGIMNEPDGKLGRRVEDLLTGEI